MIRLVATSSESAALLFDPARLAQARRLRGLLKSELAALVDVTAGAISQFEAGVAKPAPATLARLAMGLRVPVDFLVRGRTMFHVAEGEANFRSLRSTTKRERSQAGAEVELLAEIVEQLGSYVALPTEDISRRHLGSDPEAAADELRETWSLGIGPISNLVGLLERHGVVVARLPSESDRVDAFSCWISGRPYVLLRSNKESADRSRFDAGHELGHLVLHPDASPGIGEAEVQAHRFASAFLLPRPSLLAELPPTPNLARLVELKRRWKVSIQALLRRGKDLGVYSDASYRRAFQQIGVRGWRTSEPGDAGPPEQPELLGRAVALMNTRYGDGIGFLAERTGLPLGDLSRLLSMASADRPVLSLPDTDDTLRSSLIRKLDPARFPDMSGKMAAVVGYILEAPFSEPSISELTVTPDGYVVAKAEDDLRHDQFFGDRKDLDRNLVGLLNVTPDLTEDEIAFFGRLQRARIKRWSSDGQDRR